MTSILIFLRPHLDFVPGAMTVYLADLIIIVIILLSFFIIKVKVYSRHYKLLGISLLFILALLFPTIVNYFKQQPSLEVLIDYAKIIYFVLVFWFLYFLLIKIPNRENLTAKIVNKTFLIVFVVSIIQLINPPLLGDIIRAIYGSEKLRDITSGNARVYGTFYNANWFGVYLVFFLAWLNSSFIYKKITFKKYIVSGSLLAMLLIVSGSRTAMVGAIICILFQFVDIKNKKNVAFLSVASMIVFLGVRSIAYKVPELDGTLRRFTSTIDIFRAQGTSISELNPARWNSWMRTIDLIKDNLFFGSGSTSVIGIPHNSYLYLFNMFGLIGAISIITLVFTFFYFRRLESVKFDRNRVINKWKLGFMPAFLVMSLTAEFMVTTQVMLLVIYIYAVGMFPVTTNISRK